MGGRRKLMTSFLVFFILLVVIPVSAIFYVLKTVYQKILVDNYTEYMVQKERNIADILYGEIEDSSLLLASVCLVNDSELLNLASALQAGTSAEQRLLLANKLKAELNYTFLHRSEIGSIVFFYDTPGVYYYKNNIVVNEQQARQEPWYREALDSSGKVSVSGIYKGTVSNSKERYSIDLAFCPGEQGTGNQVEMVRLSYFTHALDRDLADQRKYSRGETMIVDARGMIMISDRKELEGQNIHDISYLAQAASEDNSAYRETVAGRKVLVTSCDAGILDLNWKIINLSDYEQIVKESNMVSLIFFSIICVTMILFAGFAAIFFRGILIPINQLAKGMEQIENSNFAYRIELKGNIEIRNLTASYNKMAGTIDTLICQISEQEREKLRAEMEALQSQINPHFISNSLNAIRFMAIVARFESIEKMSGALIEILTTTFARGQEITVREELEMIRKYVYLMQIRYGGKFQAEYQIQDEIMEYRMLKLILQPIIENAIIHGFDGREELRHFIQNGQVVWHALAFTSHTDFCGEEEYLNSLRYARELSEQFQKPFPIAAKMTDVPGHGLMLPEVLAASGIRFLHLGCNAFATPPQVPGLFYWQAPSGRKVLTMYGKGGYGSSLETPKEWEFPVWMALVHTHDNSGPHTAEFIRGLEQEARALYPGAEIVCGTMDDFCRELEQCDLSRVPVVDQDLADTWIHGIGAYPREVGRIRAMRHRSTRLQKQYWQGGGKTPAAAAAQEQLTDYYENMHLFGEHTWGADVKTWLGPERVYQKDRFEQARTEEKYRFMEQSWEEQRQRASQCEAALEQLEAGLDGSGADTYLYNPSVWPYTGWTGIGKQPAGETEFDLNGEALQTTEIFGETAGFITELEPFATVRLTQKPGAGAGNGALQIQQQDGLSYVENHRYSLMFQPDTGNIVRVTDKKYQSILMEEQDGIGVFSYQYTRHGIQKMTEFLRSYGYRYSTWGVQDYGREAYPECEDETYRPVFLQYTIEGDTICFAYQGGTSVKAYGDAAEVRVKITLPPVGEELFVELELAGKEQTPYLESGSFCMPLSAGAQDYYLNKNGSCLNPRTDIRAQANQVYYAVEEFAAADNGRQGVCVMPKDTPLLSIGEDGMYLYRKSYEERSGVLFFNTFNNMWGTNFPQWQGGDYRYRFVLWGYQAAERSQLYTRSIQLAEGTGIVHTRLEKPDIQLPEALQLLNAAGDSGQQQLITRDLSGVSGAERIMAPGYQITEVDYFGRVTGKVQQDSYSFTRLKYGLHLFRLTKR